MELIKQRKKMERISNKSLIILSLLLSTELFAGGPIVSLDVPNSFSAGAPAVAEEVNANFESIENVLNGNSHELELRIERLITMVEALEARLATIEGNTVLDLDTKLYLDTDTAGKETAIFRTVDVKISSHDVADTGNLIIGENRPYLVEGAQICTIQEYKTQESCEANSGEWSVYVRKGSHNLIVGNGNSYHANGSVIFGVGNGVTENYSTIVGGSYNKVHASLGSILGGHGNNVSAIESTIVGGRKNLILNTSGVISSGSASSILGGSGNSITSRWYGTISGGSANTVTGDGASISGGKYNTAAGISSAISGGYTNSTTGESSVVSGGRERSTAGIFDWAAGTLSADE